MTKVSEAFPSNYLKCADLNDKPHQLIMANVDMETIGDDRRPVLYFKSAKKGLVLNKTNANNISYIYGDDMDDWAGEAIELYPATTDFQGKTVDCIRVRKPKKSGKSKPSENPAEGMTDYASEIDDEIPF